jgi:type IV pilus assembly protein PilM
LRREQQRTEMDLKKIFRKEQKLIGLDIGMNSVKFIELDLSGDKPRLLALGRGGIPDDCFAGNSIAQIEPVSERIQALMEANGITDRAVVTAVPGPSVFTKRVKLGKVSYDELRENIQFEAANLIPHSIQDVKLDFHILGEVDKKQLEVLVVAVKNEIIDSFLNTIAYAGLETAVVDVDYYALQNAFEIAYPEHLSRTVAILNMGGRYSSMNICQNGQSLFAGDIAVGGRVIRDALKQECSCTTAEADLWVMGKGIPEEKQENVRFVMEKTIDSLAADCNRQLSFFWNASGAEHGIEKIFLSGGAALTPGLREKLFEKTGIECEIFDPFRNIDLGSEIDVDYTRELGPTMAICVGLALRTRNDKILPEYLEQ